MDIKVLTARSVEQADNLLAVVCFDLVPGKLLKSSKKSQLDLYQVTYQIMLTF